MLSFTLIEESIYQYNSSFFIHNISRSEIRALISESLICDISEIVTNYGSFINSYYSSFDISESMSESISLNFILYLNLQDTLFFGIFTNLVASPNEKQFEIDNYESISSNYWSPSKSSISFLSISSPISESISYF